MGESDGKQRQVDPARKAVLLLETRVKSVVVAYILAIWFFGPFGSHRFYLNRPRSAVAMFLIFLPSVVLFVRGLESDTGSLVGEVGMAIVYLWVIVDLFLIPGIVRRRNDEIYQTIMGYLLPQQQ